MIILDKGIVFIHIPKTAGDSIEYLLEQEYHSPTRMGRHQPLSFFLQEGYDIKTIFTVMRNPFDRLVSVYHFCNVRVPFPLFLNNIRSVLLNKPKIPMKSTPVPYNPRTKHHQVEVYNFPRCRLPWPMIAPFRYWVPLEQLDNVHVLRFEKIQEEWEKFKDKVGVQEALPHRNQNPKKTRDYREFYGEKEIELVKEIYGWELDYFGYSL